MDDLDTPHDKVPLRILAGAMAHLARHMENGCARSAYLAAMLLEQIVADRHADAHLRQHAQQLVEILEREPGHSPAAELCSRAPSPALMRRPIAGNSVQ